MKRHAGSPGTEHDYLDRFVGCQTSMRRLGRALKDVKYLFMVLPYLLRPPLGGWLGDRGAAASSVASQLRISSTSF